MEMGAFDERLETFKMLVDAVNRFLDAMRQFTGSCGDAAEEVRKRTEQLRVSKAGWKNRLLLTISHNARSVEAVPVASCVRKSTSATGE